MNTFNSATFYTEQQLRESALLEGLKVATGKLAGLRQDVEKMQLDFALRKKDVEDRSREVAGAMEDVRFRMQSMENAMQVLGLALAGERTFAEEFARLEELAHAHGGGREDCEDDDKQLSNVDGLSRLVDEARAVLSVARERTERTGNQWTVKGEEAQRHRLLLEAQHMGAAKGSVRKWTERRTLLGQQLVAMQSENERVCRDVEKAIHENQVRVVLNELVASVNTGLALERQLAEREASRARVNETIRETQRLAGIAGTMAQEIAELDALLRQGEADLDHMKAIHERNMREIREATDRDEARAASFSVPAHELQELEKEVIRDFMRAPPPDSVEYAAELAASQDLAQRIKAERELGELLRKQQLQAAAAAARGEEDSSSAASAASL